MFTMQLSRAERDQIINQRYINRWVHHNEWLRQYGLVSLIKPAGELATILAQRGQVTVGK